MLLNSPLLCPSWSLLCPHCWSLLMQETLLLWGLFLVDLLLFGVEELEEAWGVVWGGVVVGGEVQKVIVRGGGKPKLAGPHTWVRSTLRKVSNNGFQDKSLRPLQRWGSCCLAEPFFSSRVCPLHPIQSKAHKSWPNIYQKQALSFSCLLAVTACTYPLLDPRFKFKLPVARFFQHDAITVGRRHPYLRHSLVT